MHDTFLEHKVNSTLPKYQFKGFPIISDQITKEGLTVVWQELDKILSSNVEGNIVEFGCYAGTSSLFIRRLLDQHSQSDQRQFHVYDSFDGLPEKSPQDHNAAGVDFTAGKLYVSKSDFIKQFRAAHLQPPIIHKKWFNEVTPTEVPAHIAFAFLDGDFYQSIIDSLKLVWPRLDPAGTIMIDDYKRETLPGVERAITEYFANKPVSVRAAQNIAIIKPL